MFSKNLAYYTDALWRRLLLETGRTHNTRKPMQAAQIEEEAYYKPIHSALPRYWTHKYFPDLRSILAFVKASQAQYVQESPVPNPLGMAFLGIYAYDAFLEHGSEEALTVFLKQIEDIQPLLSYQENAILFTYPKPEPQWELGPNWTCALTQGMLASYFLRYYLHTKNTDYAAIARKLLQPLLVPIENDGLLRIEGGCTWLEEYPSPRLNAVMNGQISTCIALLEYNMVSPDDDSLFNITKDATATAISNIPTFRYGAKYWYYCLYDNRLCNLPYGLLHAYELVHLGVLLHDATLLQEGQEWISSYGNSTAISNYYNFDHEALQRQNEKAVRFVLNR